jgi:hypothetical protein
MNRLTSRLSIGSLKLPFVTDISIESSWQLLTDTARIILPKNLTIDSKPAIDGNRAVFKIGDKVKIELGYDYQFDTVFEGYVADVKTKIPLEILCEDQMWLFKQHSYKKTFKAVTVKQLIDFLMEKLPTKFPIVYSDGSMNLGKFRINLATGTQVLDELRKTYGIQSYFREGTLYVGFAYSHETASYIKIIPFQFSDTIIEDDLIYKNADNIRLKIVGTALNANNVQLKAEAGDGDGIQVPRFYYHKTQAQLQALVNNDAKMLKISGFQGGFTTFGKPYVRQGDAVQLRDTELPERDGTYLVNAVVREFGINGYRQMISIDRKIS